MGDLTDSLTPSSANSRQLPIREDCWSEDATSTLIDAWGRRFLDLNRGNLRQKDWQDVADSVNSLHGLTKKTHRTDVQCKNRIDTVKKKYKTERARVSASHGNFVSSWPFYARLDELIGPTVSMKKPSSPPLALPLPFLRQMVELEKQRMQFAKDLELQRMHMFMETQVQLERIKRGKKSTPSDM
ncbi:hypothetical protein CSA_017390 [Cucumis sativus]|uniref:Uncharacterized protein n=1 Tax=Cucumis sativus TaxID=3659 RepID=A0ACB6HC70_CUCSA|nr:hypothetical protein CSA_017390 [Cucumis sativus]